MVEQSIVVRNKTGLHLRPATELANLCAKMPSKIQILFNGKSINPKSVLMLMGSGIKAGSEIVVRCDGATEDADLQAILDAINGGFGEEMIDVE